MKIGAQMALVIGVIFAVVCFSVAITGFNALREITDPVQAADAHGFAWFWTFLGAIGVVFSAISWWIAKTEKGDRG